MRADVQSSGPERLNSFLGWFSLGLGLLEVAAPQWVAKNTGLGRRRAGTVRLLGARELLSGAAIMTRPRSPVGPWSRVLGDAMDLWVLSGALNARGRSKTRAIAATAAVLGVSALDVAAAVKSNSEESLLGSGPMCANETVSINRSPEELYRYWRNFSNLPKVMSYLRSVEVRSDVLSHWTLETPVGTTLEWDAEVTFEKPNEVIEWRSTEGSDVWTTGSVRFSPLPGKRGTAVTVEMTYRVEGSFLASVMNSVASLFSEEKLRQDLRRFKQLMETGEIATTRNQPAGRRSGETWLDQLAQLSSTAG